MTYWANIRRQLFLLPNVISLLRAALGIVIPFFVLSPSLGARLGASVLFAIGALSDYWDGLVARKRGEVSALGKIIDPLADKILILGPLAAFVHLGFYSVWWIAVVFAREIIITFCRFGWLYEGKAIGAETLGKYKLGAQVVLVSVSLLYLLWGNLPGAFAIRLLMFFSLLLTVFLTVLSGYTFLLSNEENLRSPGFAKFTAALGVGLIPSAPGTWGSALGVCLILLTHTNGWLYWGSFVFLLWAGWWAVSRLDLSRGKDPSYVVVDEACGMYLALMGLPLNPVTVLIAFILFRLFDIFKPFPLRRLERLPGYLGIMADDLGAGFLTWLVVLFLL